MQVNIFNQTDEKIKEYEDKIVEIFSHEKNDKSMEIIFVDDEEIQKMNKYYRNIDKVTDVLSFPNDLEEDTSIGDIFINIDRAYLQASEYEHSIMREVCFLAVHGYLHLLGYDHQTKEDEDEMFGIQEEILKKFGLERN